MAIYRAESGRRVAIIAIVALVGGLVLGLVIGRLTAPGLADQMADLRSQIAPIRSSLEVVRTEYPKLLAGGADPGGAPSAMARVQTTFDSVSPTLEKVNAAGAAEVDAAIDALASAIEAKAPAEDVAAGIDAVVAALDGAVPPVPTGG